MPAGYQAQHTPSTLREGLAQYFADNPRLTKLAPGDEGAELFLPHDACHVVFGLGTSLVEEAMVDIWTLFGADIGMGGYLKLMKHVNQLNPSQVASEIGHWVIVRDSVLGLGEMWRAMRHARAMRKKWTFHGYEAHLDRPLGELRAEFGVVVFSPAERFLAASSVRA